jgi:hypothetical protein
LKGPWSGPPPKEAQRARVLPASDVILVLALLALCGAIAAAVWMSRYELGAAGGLPARLDRFTGQVISCVPSKACFEFIPAGEPVLEKPVLKPGPAVEAPGGNVSAHAPAANAEAPAKP